MSLSAQQAPIRKSHQKRRRSSSGGTFYGEKWRMYQRSPAESGSIFQCKKRCFGRYSVGRCSVPATNSNKLWDSLIPVFCLLPPPARKFPQKTLTNHCLSGNIYRQSVRLQIEYGRVPEWPMGTDCKSAAFSFGGSNPPAPTKKSSIRTGYWIFCFADTFSGLGGMTAACGGNREARLRPRSGFLFILRGSRNP